MSFVPKVDEALSELRELVALGKNDVNLANSLREFIDSGSPLFRTNIDGLAAVPTVERVITYHLDESLLVNLAAPRARKVHSDNVDESHS